MNKLLFVTLLCCCFASNAQQSIRVVTENAPPLQYLSDGEVVGTTTSIVKAVLDKAGLSANIAIYPWARAYKIALTEPNTLLYPVMRNEEREEQLIWIGQLLSMQLGIVKLHSNKAMTLEQFGEVKGYKLGVMRDDYTHQMLVGMGFIEGEDYELFSNIPELLRLLYAEKIDCFIADLNLTQEMANNLGYDSSLLVSEFEFEQITPLYIAMSKGSSEQLVESLRVALKQIVK